MLRTTPLLMHLFFACAPLLANSPSGTTDHHSSSFTIEHPAPINFKRVAVAYLTVSVFLPFILLNSTKYIFEPITFGMNQLILLLYFSLSGAIYDLSLYGFTYCVKLSTEFIYLLMCSLGTSGALYGLSPYGFTYYVLYGFTYYVKLSTKFIYLLIYFWGTSIVSGFLNKILGDPLGIKKDKVKIEKLANNKNDKKSVNELFMRRFVNLISFFISIFLRTYVAWYAYGFNTINNRNLVVPSMAAGIIWKRNGAQWQPQ